MPSGAKVVSIEERGLAATITKDEVECLAEMTYRCTITLRSFDVSRV